MSDRLASGPRRRKKYSKFLQFCGWVFAVVLPCITLLFELATRGSAHIGFDPMPNVGHILLVGMVPVVLFQSMRLVRSQDIMPSWLPHALGWATFVSLAYTAFYGILMPFGVLGIIFYGIGLLVLAPLFTFIYSIRCARFLKKLNRVDRFWPKYKMGMLCAFAALVIFETPRALTHYGINMALSPDAEESARGVSLLRKIQADNELLYGRYSYPYNMIFSRGGFQPFHSNVSRNKLEKVYYRVTGQNWHTKEADNPYYTGFIDTMFADGSMFGNRRSNRWDAHQGSEVVGYRVKDLYLKESSIDGYLDSDGTVGYLEWTMVFKNENQWQAEARAYMILPEGGAISRVTLWVNGEPREAAFAGKQQVREAYERIVKRRRDPLLVTQVAPDQVMFQCFPIPGRGGEMKIRLGMSFPISRGSAEEVRFYLPRIMQQNYHMMDGLVHNLKLVANNEVYLETHDKTIGTRVDDRYQLTAKLKNPRELNQIQMVTLRRNPNVREVWAGNYVDESLVTTATFTTAPAMPYKEWVIVLDTSAELNEYRKALDTFVKQLRGTHTVKVILAADMVEEWKKPILSRPFEGGQDNIPALARGIMEAVTMENAAVLWIHGSQPVELDAIDGLGNLMMESGYSVPIYAFNATDTYSDVAQRVGKLAMKSGKPSVLMIIPRYGSVPMGLSSFLHMVHGMLGEQRLVIQSRPKADYNAGGAEHVNTHLTRLWALQEVERNLALNEEDHMAAIQFAGDYQLVTSVSGAVVLENAQQYEEAGLKPVDSDSVPVVPEPATVVIAVLLTLTVGGHQLYRRRKHRVRI